MSHSATSSDHIIIERLNTRLCQAIEENEDLRLQLDSVLSSARTESTRTAERDEHMSAMRHSVELAEQKVTELSSALRAITEVLGAKETEIASLRRCLKEQMEAHELSITSKDDIIASLKQQLSLQSESVEKNIRRVE
eukprot:PhM_4_TR9972/c0_g2_i1/m.13499